MKNLNTIIKILSFALIVPINSIPGFASRTAIQEQEAYTTNLRQGLTATYAPTPGTGTGSTCPTGQSCQPISAASSYIPSFSVFILDKNQKPLNSTGKNMLPISANSQSFTYQNTILTVNIFAPSNIATTTPTLFEKNYIVFYTLKTPGGEAIYADFDTFNSTSIPHYIAINPTGSPEKGATPTPANFPIPSSGSDYSFMKQFLPTNNFPTGQQALQILNGISPISQSFLFSMDNSQTPAQITISPISGMYDAGNFSSGSSPASSFTPSKGSNALGTLGIILDGSSTPNIQFVGKNLSFTSTDLQNSLILNIVITAQNGSNNYNIVATLRTTDGTKMRKEICLSNSANPITSLPLSITIQQSGTSILSTDFLNNQISAALPNMLLPLNLKFSISQPSGSKTIQVLMI